jgi:uncharacterized protein (TIGR03435 family)
MEQFAQSIVAPLHSPVVDATGLTGLYDFHLDIAPYLPSGPLQDGILDIPYILSQGMQEQLGLRLESRRTVIEILVIDHVERPSKN